MIDQRDMRAALEAMATAVYEGTYDDRKAALFALLMAWGFMLDELAKHELNDDRG